MDAAAQKKTVERLLERAGTTYAQQAGIRLADKPMPLFQLLTLCMLASKPIDAEIAVAAARELFDAGIRTPKAVTEAERAAVIRAFGRAHYVRYDESSATRLGDIAATAIEEYGGDLRRLDGVEHRDVATLTASLKQFKGIGDTGADIFLREVQDTWTWVRPYFDDRTMSAARELGLPSAAEELAALAPRRNADLAGALVRVSLDGDLRDALRE
ncbi:endonuclease [Mycolicibacterium flavescens]|uniref:Endonuclease n=1 Tax=Mycolicibacterium flavescens TaxID=1776 RepID=A0A1E3RKY6_MYCFV|nr:endonuclease [Mycolicibacterium flavescens]MCV7279062.1 endonuclease [Mycolicibacterium flavescens]ODQ90546.1 endonuclease [Mycolicibacterium flavescens]